MTKLPLLFIAISTAFLLALPVYAADIRLSSRCTLADAIIAANLDRAEGDCPTGRGADTITLTRDITLDGGLPKITSDITIEGGGYTISGDNRWRIFYNDGGALTINDLTMTKGRAEGALISNADGALKATTANPIGGAIVNWQGALSIANSAFSDNSAEYYGGAIYNREGKLSIIDSSFSGNSANGGGGAIVNSGELSISDSTFSSNDSAGDGAIFNSGELSISDSNFSGNSAEQHGGAIYSWGDLSIVNSTFSDNSADWSGGAIFNHSGILGIANSTFSDNLAGQDGAIRNVRNGELSIVNSIIAGNNSTCYSSNGLTQNIGNFIQDGSCSPALRGDPMLGELVELEDGSPAYFPLLAGSPAIDAADDAHCPATDQIGAARPQGAGCDIGAIEYAAP